MLASFAGDFKAPKGPLRLTLNPPDKTSATQLSNANGPEDVVKALGLVVSYSGTRPMADAPAKPADSAPAAAGSGPGGDKSDSSAPSGWGARGK